MTPEKHEFLRRQAKFLEEFKKTFTEAYLSVSAMMVNETQRRTDDHANQRHHHDSAYSRALWFSHCVPYGISLFYFDRDCQLGALTSSPRPSRYDNAMAELRGNLRCTTCYS
jgi:hypothetical protein